MTGLMALSLLGSTMVMAEDADYQQKFEAAKQASEAGASQQAVDLWRELLQQYPDDVAANNNLAVVLMQQKRYDQAQQQLEGVLKADPKLSVLWENLNQLYAVQAQQAYRSVFKKAKVSEPTAKWMAAPQQVPTLDSQTTQMIQANQEKVLNQLENWRAAWAGQKVADYLSFYTADYVAPNYANHKSWAKGRERSLERPKFIRLQLKGIQVQPLGMETVQTRFQQQYESNRFKDTVTKQVVWQLQNDAWQIIQEQVIYD